MKVKLPKNIFEGLPLMYYSNTNVLSGSNAWIGTGGYTGSYRLQEDTLSEKVSDAFKSVGQVALKIIKPTFLFSFYQLFTSPMPEI